MSEYLYSFNEINDDMINTIGLEGANLVVMTKMGLPIPFGFNISTKACEDFFNGNGKLPEEFVDQLNEKIEEVEMITNRKYGSQDKPLLFAIRANSSYDMPGVLENIINIGINDEICQGLGNLFNSKILSLNMYLNYIEIYGILVYGISPSRFHSIYHNQMSHTEKKEEDILEDIVAAYKKLLLAENKKGFPSDVHIQLQEILRGIFMAWRSSSTMLYKRVNNISEQQSLSLNVQEITPDTLMEKNLRGSVFTRSPIDGNKTVYGEYVGYEDFVFGNKRNSLFHDLEELKKEHSEAYEELVSISKLLENKFKDMQNIEFAITGERIKIISVTRGKRTAKAAIKIAVDMVEEGLLNSEDVISQMSIEHIKNILHPQFVEEQNYLERYIDKGNGLSPGDATGRICFDLDRAIRYSSKNEKVILVKEYATPYDLAGIMVSDGLITKRGGKTSHSAVIARGLGKPAVALNSKININEENKVIKIGDNLLYEGQYISISGTTGKIYKGRLPIEIEKFSEELKILLKWADQARKIKVKVNADNIKDIKIALDFGAEGIGLCRTEHMFYREERLIEFRKAILDISKDETRKALDKLKEFQKKDFIDIYKLMQETPTTIRLLDPNYSEFMPTNLKEKIDLATLLDQDFDIIEKKLYGMEETNPLLGYRGIRTAVDNPDILIMQIKAIVEAALEVNEEENVNIVPEILVPFVSGVSEFKYVKKIIIETIENILHHKKASLEWQIGAMIETPRAALISDLIAKEADFLAFGTNDLTQLTYGISRDDTRLLVKDYIRKEILSKDPFEELDFYGVGRLMEMSVKQAKHANPKIRICMCGEQSADPNTIEFCSEIGTTYISCSPYQVPVARVASAQTVINKKIERERE